MAYAAEGAKIVLVSRNAEKLELVAKEIQSAGGSALVVPVDVTDEEAVIDLFRQTVEAFDRVDILVNNVGVSKGVPSLLRKH